MTNYTGKIIRRVQGAVCKAWRVRVDNVPENAKYAGKIINATSDIQGLGVDDRVSLRIRKVGNSKNTYLKLNICAKIQESPAIA
ncbi:MAG: hypothetical protein UV60_C0028G0009 [Parcubacteria group bacterium GW2011_GWA2_43_11]|nr:MAG: hypothetical protein UU89_C0026G0011 [Parcubacteria group bacterium GW2011_GWC2_42_11]KKS84117.1 MAG: hypothetical protein UV60_C0028G0009 [Parcubacteria group bacterium GW2011_GWA2_43_11]